MRFDPLGHDHSHAYCTNDREMYAVPLSGKGVLRAVSLKLLFEKECHGMENEYFETLS